MGRIIKSLHCLLPLFLLTNLHLTRRRFTFRAATGLVGIVFHLHFLTRFICVKSSSLAPATRLSLRLPQFGDSVASQDIVSDGILWKQY
jgi:hypothetical protein